MQTIRAWYCSAVEAMICVHVVPFTLAVEFAVTEVPREVVIVARAGAKDGPAMMGH
jgi:hypothetical protein